MTEFKIRNHRLVRLENGKEYGGDRFVPTRKMSGNLRDPLGIVLHYTASWTHRSSVNTLATSSRKASAHIVVPREEPAEVTQIVPFNRVAWHAGPSTYSDGNITVRGCNAHTIGIEIDNFGYIYEDGEDTFRTYIEGVTYSRATLPDGSNLKGWGKHPHKVLSPRISDRAWWQPYPEEQLNVVAEIVKALIAKYDIKFITRHEDIDTRGWKSDPGPMFPFDRFERLLDTGQWDREAETAPPPPVKEGVLAKVIDSDVNLRNEPVWGTAPTGAVAAGTYLVAFPHTETNSMVYIVVDTPEATAHGWIAKQYLEYV